MYKNNQKLLILSKKINWKLESLPYVNYFNILLKYTFFSWKLWCQIVKNNGFDNKSKNLKMFFLMFLNIIL